MCLNDTCKGANEELDFHRRMDQDLENAQAYVAAKNYEAAFNILHTIGIRTYFLFTKKLRICFTILVSKNVKPNDEEDIRIKEQAILDLGSLLKQTKKAKG